MYGKVNVLVLPLRKVGLHKLVRNCTFPVLTVLCLSKWQVPGGTQISFQVTLTQTERTRMPWRQLDILYEIQQTVWWNPNTHQNSTYPLRRSGPIHTAPWWNEAGPWWRTLSPSLQRRQSTIWLYSVRNLEINHSNELWCTGNPLYCESNTNSATKPFTAIGLNEIWLNVFSVLPFFRYEVGCHLTVHIYRIGNFQLLIAGKFTAMQ